MCYSKNKSHYKLYKVRSLEDFGGKLTDRHRPNETRMHKYAIVRTVESLMIVRIKGACLKDHEIYLSKYRYTVLVTHLSLCL